jgi:FkbM family methyltransferase
MQRLLNTYRFIFVRKGFHRANYHLHRIALRGVGVLNSEGPHITGESDFLKNLSKYSDIKTIVDVGANTGEYAQELRFYFPKATIYAIEPHPKTFKKLSSLAKKEKLRVFNQGLGDHVGKGKLWDFADDAVLKHTQPTSTLASTLKEVIEDLHGQKAQAYEFPMNTLDNFVKQEKIEKIDFLKIDIEGAEISVLHGAKQLLKNKSISFIQFEFNEMNAYSKTFFKDFMDVLPQHLFYRIMPRGLYSLGAYRPSTHEIFAFQNIVAIPKEYGSIAKKL